VINDAEVGLLSSSTGFERHVVTDDAGTYLLLDNAIKFTKASGRVEVCAVRSADEVILEVEDTGIGISQQDLPRIFDRFYQADSSRSGKGVGPGPFDCTMDRPESQRPH
jgi:light-regulated signal transduction histidine kinase (bacteriophytochrome)